MDDDSQALWAELEWRDAVEDERSGRCGMYPFAMMAALAFGVAAPVALVALAVWWVIG